MVSINLGYIFRVKFLLLSCLIIFMFIKRLVFLVIVLKSVLIVNRRFRMNSLMLIFLYLIV